MTDLIRIEKSKLVKIVELARNNRGINIDDLLQLAMVDVEHEKIVEKEVAYEQEVIELDPDEVVAVEKEKTYRKRRWTTGEEKNFIKMVESEVDYNYISEKLKRSKNALYNKAHELREAGRLTDSSVNQYANGNKPYQDYEDTILRQALKRYREVAEIPHEFLDRTSVNLGRSVDALRTRLYLLQDKEF